MTQLHLISLVFFVAGLFLGANGCCQFPTHSKSAITNVTEADFKCDEPVSINCLSYAVQMSASNNIAVASFPGNSTKEYDLTLIGTINLTQAVWCNAESNKWRVGDLKTDYEAFACAYTQWVLDV